MDLLTYNAFGMVTATSQSVAATIVVVKDGKQFSRAYIHETEIPEVQPGESVAVLFGVMVEKNPDHPIKLSIYSVGELRSGENAADLKSVRHAIKEVVQNIQNNLL